MSTRSIIVVTGQNAAALPLTIRLYKHMDGYPTANLRLIFLALAPFLMLGGEMSVTQAAGALIASSADEYGIGARTDFDDDDTKIAQYNEAFKPAHLGRQEDLEWIYVVDMGARTITIYGGAYTGEPPQAAFNRGPVDPEIYASRLHASLHKAEVKKTRKLVAAIGALGFKVNP